MIVKCFFIKISLFFCVVNGMFPFIKLMCALWSKQFCSHVTFAHSTFTHLKNKKNTSWEPDAKIPKLKKNNVCTWKGLLILKWAKKWVIVKKYNEYVTVTIFICTKTYVILIVVLRRLAQLKTLCFSFLLKWFIYTFMHHNQT